jgi:Tol biopolymer transport system component/C-terminal processing protease CtpA/Prc
MIPYRVATAPNSRPSFAEPSLAPDRSEIVFVSGGDIWTAPLTGGEARLLVSHPANEARPLYSPDGKRLAFMSNRSGSDEIYMLDLASGDTRRLTYDNATVHLDSWSRDGKWIYFSSSVRDISGMGDIFRVSPEGGTPMVVAGDRYASEYWAAPSPSGDSLAITAKGITAGQWWRHGHSHLDESEIWLVRFGEDNPAYQSVASDDSKNEWPMWTPDGKRLYFVSDRSGNENLWVRDIGSKSPPRQLTNFTKGRVLWPSVSADGKTIVFERDFEIWRFDTESAKAAPVEITLRGAPAGPDVTRLSATAQFHDMQLSPDGRKVAFASHGEIFAASSKDGGTAARVSNSVANEFEPVWSRDSRKVVYVSDRDGVYHIYEYDFASAAETRLTSDPAGETSPEWSPDGKTISFVRGGNELIAYNVATKQERKLAEGWFGRPPQRRPIEWSPDSQWVAYAAIGSRGFQNIYAVPAAGETARPLTFIPNSFVQSIQWSPDGSYLLFTTAQRTEPSMLIRVDLVPKTPKFREDQFRDLFKEEPPKILPSPPVQAPASEPAKPAVTGAKPATKVNIVFEGIRLRARPVPLGIDAGGVRISPDGKTLLFVATAASQQNLYTYSLDELAKEPPVARQLTSTPGGKSDAQWSPDGKDVFYLEGGKLQTINVENRQSKPVAITAEMDVSFAEEKMEVFHEAWTFLNENFYDVEFHGASWKSVRAQFEPQIEGARTPDEERRLISLMLGELNASHLGISAGPPGSTGNPVPSTGRIGVRFDRLEFEQHGRLRVSEVISLSPAEVAGIKAGQYIFGVDGESLAPTTNIDRLLEHKVDRRVVLSVGTSPDGKDKKEVVLRPVSTQAEKQLLYRQWVENRRDYVHRASEGRLGYVHMPDMSSNSLEQLYLDLDTENQSRDGVIIDIRNNNGGFVNAYALDVLARRPYINMTPRGLTSAAPARSMLGQRALERPTILVVNQHSLSDAEDFTEGYRTLKLGKVVGEPTAGWIIYTGGTQLIDGSILRLPMIRITTNEGVTMERNPRSVDIRVDRPLGESYSGKDSQLDVAARELLKEIGEPKNGKTGPGIRDAAASGR